MLIHIIDTETAQPHDATGPDPAVDVLTDYARATLAL